MSSAQNQISQVMREARSMPFGRQRSALMEHAVALADAAEAQSQQVRVRLELTSSYRHGNEQAKALAPFSWVKSLALRDPEAIGQSEHTLLWSYKYVCETLIDYPQFTLTQIDDLLADMEENYRRAGSSFHAVHGYRNRYLRQLGDLSGAEDAYRHWVTSTRDDLSDCISCDLQNQIDWLADEQRFDEAIASAEPVLAGLGTCSEQPAGIMSTITIPFLAAGSHARAIDVHRSGYELSRRRRSDVGWISNHLQFCALTGNAARGIEILERHLPWLDESGTPRNEMVFAASAARLLAEVVDQGGDQFEVETPTGIQTVTTLHAELSGRAVRLAAAFDVRNGSSAATESMMARMSAPRLVDSLPLGLSA